MSVSRGNSNKSKTKQMEPNQTYKPLPNKENHKQNEKITCGVGYNICSHAIWLQILLLVG